ncbi:unnamed protein product [Aphanomyces euteiches]
MGAMTSRWMHTMPEYPVGDEMTELFSSLGFSVRDLNQIYHLFNAVNTEGTGAINVHEFLAYFGTLLQLSKTEFTKKTFKLMDKDESGKIDFEEFVLSLWNFCSFHPAALSCRSCVVVGSFTRESLVRYAFSLYDSDGSGDIDVDEAEHFVHEMWGDKWHSNKNAEAIMAKLRAIAKANDGYMPIENFVVFAHDHPLLMFPAFQIQHDMVEKILGEHFWTKIADQREKKQRTDKKFKTIEDILRSFNHNHAVLRRTRRHAAAALT